MFNSLLGEVNIDSMILDIFIILAVVVASALVVYFLWEAISALSKNAKDSAGKDQVLNEKFATKEKIAKKEKEKSKEDVVVVDYSLDAQEEVKEEPKEQSLIDENKMTDVDEAKAEEEKVEVEAQVSDEERANAERRAYLEARRQELIRRMQAEMEEEKEEQEENLADEEATEQETETTEQQSVEVEDAVENEDVQEVVETQEVETEEVETENAEADEEVESNVEEVAEQVEAQEQVDALEEERKELQTQKEKYEAMVKELELAKKALAEQKVETIQKIETIQVPTNGVLSLDELRARLADAEEKLASTTKEFKQCKKEYIPLRKVWKAHEKDEKKLRRKEALVAKQKVILYGVNNYADIDEEKAKKLAEDLDLLDGLKLSVQHCEEVMEKNADRYPLLEKMYNVLNARNEELKADIEYYKAEIAKLEEEQSENGEIEEN